jgi:hypothetical protein
VTLRQKIVRLREARSLLADTYRQFFRRTHWATVENRLYSDDYAYYLEIDMESVSKRVHLVDNRTPLSTIKRRERIL